MKSPKVIFVEKNHRYFLNKKNSQLPLQSVSSFYAEYKNEFNTDFWASYKTYEKILPPGIFKDLKKIYGYDSPELLTVAKMYITDVNYFETVKENFKQSWQEKNKKSTDKGTSFHNLQETNSYITGAGINQYNLKCYPILTTKILPYANYTLTDNLYDLPEGFYPELLIFNEECLIAGQADKVFITEFEGEKYIDIGDFKTNEKISKKSFRDSKGHKYMKPPLEDIMDSNYWHYVIQLSTYAFMLEKFGFKVRSLYLQHYDEIYFLPYLFKKIQKLYEIRLKKL